MVKSPIASMKYKGGLTPKGIPAQIKGKTKSSDMPAKKMKVPTADNEFNKSATLHDRPGKVIPVKHGKSGLPYKGGDDNKKRYNGYQGPNFSMDEGAMRTKFVC